MTAVTQSQAPDRHESGAMIYPVSANKVYAGTLKNLNSSGYLEEATDAASKVFAGVGAEEVDNSGGSAGDLNARVYNEGVFEFAIASVAITDIGTKVYILDNNTVALAAGATNDITVGTIVGYKSSTRAMVDISLGARA